MKHVHLNDLSVYTATVNSLWIIKKIILNRGKTMTEDDSVDWIITLWEF